MSRVLVVNTGSSSLKLTVVDGTGPDPVAAVHVADWAGHDVTPIADLVRRAGTVDAVGHRVVHGGAELTAATVVDDGVRAHIEALTPMAPLHQGRALEGLAAAQVALPELPHVASTPPSTPPCRRRPGRTRCRRRGARPGGCSASASMGCRTRTSSGGPPSWWGGSTIPSSGS